jgi:methylenetetrahydrofolate reductase (NADPH)
MANNMAVSFEFFPPSDDEMARQLWSAVQRLAPLRPNFVSVTYGADGSTRSRTHDCVLRILRETELRVAPHLTCVGATPGFTSASQVVAGLKRTANFDISVAAYPEGHPESGTVEADLENLKRKIDAGASRAITQFFFDTDHFLRYRDRCVAAAMNIQIVPGILPITRFPQLLRFAERCGTSVRRLG